MTQIKNKKILIISLNAIGDSYLSSSLLNLENISAINNSYHIVTLIDAKFIIDDFDYEKRFYIKRKNFISILSTLIKIILNKYDFAFSFFGGRLNTLLFILCRAKFKSGYINFRKIEDWSRRKVKLFLKGIKREEDIIWEPYMNFMDRIKLALKPFGIDVKNIRKPIFQNLNYEDDGKTIIINYDSKIPGKRIAVDTVLKLIVYLSDTNKYHISLIDVNDKVKTDKVKLFKKLSLDEILSLLSHCTLFVTTDSFLLHLADAHNVKTLGVFFETNPESVFCDFKDKYWIKLKQDSINNAELIFNKIKDILF
ncbi:MAG: hypothetical protein N2490_09515 [Ignavibacteria bacterium]|nr:hypothetical protein [Ignavibacteria bacterium]